MKLLYTLFLASLLLYGPFLSQGNHLASKTERTDTTQIDDGNQITLHAARRGNPWIKLRDGVELATVYAGEPALTQALERNQAKPCSMASGDFDEDGFADLVIGYADSGGGLLALHRGNLDAVYPNSLEAQQRRAQGQSSHSPFLSPANIFVIPETAQFLGTGDFDADGHSDVVTAARGSNKLYFQTGDGRGHLKFLKAIPLPGLITALATGDSNRSDGLTDVIVAVKREDASEVFAFESPEGASRAEPEVYILSEEVKAISLARLDDDYLTDMALGVGSEFTVIHGRDRKLSLDARQRAAVQPASISKLSLPFPINSIAIGDFKGDHRLIAAVLSEDGKINLVSPEMSSGKKQNWISEPMDTGAWPRSTQLISARVSSIPGDDLIVVDAIESKLHIITADPTAADQSNAALHIRDSHIKGRATASLEVEGEPVAALTMRLNADALSDLVILRNNHSAVSVVLTDAAAGFADNDLGAQSLKASENSGPPLVPSEEYIFTSNSDPTGFITKYRASDGSQVWRISSTHTINATTHLPRLLSVYRDFLYVAYGTRYLAQLRASDGHRNWLIDAGITIGITTYFVDSVSVFNGFIYTTNFDPNGFITKYRESDGGQVWRITSSHTITNTTHLPRVLNASGDSLYLGYGSRYLSQLRASDGQRNWLVEAGVTQGITTYLISSISASGNSVYTTNFDPDGFITKYKACDGEQVWRRSSIYTIPPTNYLPRFLNASADSLYVGYGSRYLSKLDESTLSREWLFDAGITQFPTTYFLTSIALDEIQSVIFSVTNTNNSGCGSLRQAILDANANPGADTISFQIGTGEKAIQLTSALPAITDVVTIDGTTQPGFSGTPIIILDGSGVTTPPINGLSITAGSSVVRGLVINRFSGNGINITTNGGNIIEGNFIGVNQSGTADLGNAGHGVGVDSPNNLIGGTASSARNLISGNNQIGISIGGVTGTGTMVQGNYIGTNASGTAAIANSSHGIITSTVNNTIGGTSPAARNVISGNGASGVALSGSVNNQVQGNFIGTDATGTAPLMNSNGILINVANSNLIGGTAAGAGNLISGNLSAGIQIQNGSTSNQVQGNLIGVNASASGALGNAGSGITILTSSSNNTLGGVATGAGNIIAFNGSNAVRIISGAGNAIRSNAIFSNTGVGIELGAIGVTANDTGDADAGANNLQNFPVLNSVTGDGVSTIIQGTLNSTANTSFAVEFFSNASCDSLSNGEGQTLIGSAMLTTDNCGNASIDLAFPVMIPAGHLITTTATDSNNNTSEFSQCISPGAASCGFLICPSSQHFTTSGGLGSVIVTATDCNWTATTNDTWITIKAGNSSGDGTVEFAVSENATGLSRQGTLTIANLVMIVVQDGGAGDNCTYSISPTYRAFAASGGAGAINVTAPDRCSRQATSTVNWVTITSGNVGIGNGVVTYTVAANLSAAGRQGVIIVAGRAFLVKQKGG
jgi:hypothetical protein